MADLLALYVVLFVVCAGLYIRSLVKCGPSTRIYPQSH